MSTKPNTAVVKREDEPEVVRTARKFDVSVETMLLARAISGLILDRGGHKRCDLPETIDALRLVLEHHCELLEMIRGGKTTWH